MTAMTAAYQYGMMKTFVVALWSATSNAPTRKQLENQMERCINVLYAGGSDALPTQETCAEMEEYAAPT